MVKIKVKKEMTLPELIKCAGENRIKDEKFLGSSGVVIYFYFDEDSWVSIHEPNLIEPDETFEVEVEEEIDENTKVPTLIELFVSDYGQIIYKYYIRTSIKEAIGDVEKDTKALSKAFYILNDDLSMTLIWRNGGMVE
ncbi:hypothetical protein BU647_02845 [Staphylococcus chromogenes]|uniref:hypothetical protein n=1 Tax=Staphylococcus chromogenes TaxID=46126 RepID=UPI000D19D520|nr:hypothetical protein [Staphylococcus chromogenes]PTG09748.1 hypothetical protein BU647_02845 [Staphylococcus chromogenes]